MARAKSDDENEPRSHPLAQERPGVYVQVVAPRRRKARPSSAQETPPGEARVAAVAEIVSPVQMPYLARAIDARPKPSTVPPALEPELPTAMVAAAPDTERPSGERTIGRTSVISVVPSAPRFSSENSNGRGDLVMVSLPPPPRLPSFDAQPVARMNEERDEEEEPSPLDVVHTLRPATFAVKALSWPTLAFVAAVSAIAASAGVVAWRGSPGTAEESPRIAVPVAPSAKRASAPIPRVEPIAAPEPSIAAPMRADAPTIPSSARVDVAKLDVAKVAAPRAVVVAPKAVPASSATPAVAPIPSLAVAVPAAVAVPVSRPVSASTVRPLEPPAAQVSSPAAPVEQPSELPQNPYE